MADTKTAAEWKQASKDLVDQSIEVNAQADAARQRLKEIPKLLFQASQSGNVEAGQALRAEQATLRVQVAETEKKAEDLGNQAQAADAEAAKAEQGPPDTQTNAPPVKDPSTEKAADTTAANTAASTEDIKTASTSTTVDSNDPAAARAQLQAEENRAGITGTDAPTTASAEAKVSPTTSQAKDTEAVVSAKTKNQTDVSPFVPAKDWRIRLSLAPGAKYLYKANNPGILAPLVNTGGVIFPYTPSISITYAAHYDTQDLVHSNYKSYSYKNSSVDQVSITADFTAQNTSEANYLLAVIHFLRSASKMFYGQDSTDSGAPRGTPPPLLYLSGYGAYQFDNHPLAITSFTYSLPTDVDYISANITTDAAGASLIAPLSPNENLSNAQNGAKKQNPIDKFKSTLQRLTGSGLKPGAKPAAPVFTSNATINDATRVPTKIQLQMSFIPIVTRDAISNSFSLKDYASGQLLRGSKNAGTGGGIW